MSERIALVMLPGAFIEPPDFAAHGFVKALRRRRLPVDAIAADLPAHLYLDGDVSPLLHAQVMALPVSTQKRIWLLGISLGGLGALLYATAYPERVEGLILIAPFLGSRGLVAEVENGGGLNAWQPGTIGPFDYARRLMSVLKRGVPPRLYIGYGRSDRFAASSVLLSGALPPERVIAVEGDHDWNTWERLWDGLLDTQPFTTEHACAV